MSNMNGFHVTTLIKFLALQASGNLVKNRQYFIVDESFLPDTKNKGIYGGADYEEALASLKAAHPVATNGDSAILNPIGLPPIYALWDNNEAVADWKTSGTVVTIVVDNDGHNVALTLNGNVLSADYDDSAITNFMNSIHYFDYAGSIYGAKYNLLASAWESSLAVDINEISADSSTSTPKKGTAQYPDGETEGVIIPQGVTHIGEYAFNGWDTNNQPLVIPNSVTSIGDGAFQGWNINTQPLVIPNSVMSIGHVAFAHWTANKHPLVIPESVTSIGEYTFASWSLVPYVEMKSETPPTIDSTAFYDQNGAPIYVPDASVDAYKTANNWAGLANRIFSINDKLIGDATASAPDPYFNYAGSIYGTKYDLLTNAWESSLAVDPLEISADTTQAYPAGTIQYPNGQTEGIIIPHGITYIGQNTFIGGSINLPLVIPGSVTSIGDGAFRGWGSNKQLLVIPNSVTSIGDSAFRDWSGNDQPLILPNSITNIGDQAFAYWHTNNQPLTMPLGVTTIGIGAFEYWTANNQPLTILNSLVNITANAFQYWVENNQPLVIANGVMNIGDGAFKYWPKNNQPLILPDSITSIGDEAFSQWVDNNKPLTIGNGVTSIGDNAFYYWAANNYPLVIPDSVTSIGNGAFNIWPSNNKPLTIGNGVTSIGDNAFNTWPENNHPLVIPASVTSIGATAFSGWPKVPYVEMQSETPPTIFDPGVFSGQNDAPIYVPDASLDDYKTATNWMHLASRIFSINDKVIEDNTYSKDEIDLMIGDIESLLGGI